MACEFSIPFHQTPAELIAKAKQTIGGAGGTFEGTAEAGLFDLKTPLGTVAGNYTIQDGQLSVVIGKKPLMISCGLIKTQLQNYLAG